MKTAKEIISSISEELFLSEPLMFDVFCSHKIVENESLSTVFRTGKRRIEYNPKLVEEKPYSTIKEYLKNEIMRILLKHPYERVPPEPNRIALKKASDITISDILPMSRNLTNAQYYNFKSGMSYEEYYKELKDICPDAPENGKADFETSELWGDDAEMCDKIDAQIKKASSSNQWGSLAGTEIEKIIAKKNITMDYKKILTQFRSSMMSDLRILTRQRPNRRYGFDYMGSRYKPTYNLLVAVDSSGSISKEDLEDFFSVINRFFKYGAKNIKVIVFDVNITQELDLKRARNEIDIKGRGGTDFQAAVDYYENSSDYDGMIVFTDGYADKPKRQKTKKILWILSSKENYEFNRWLEQLPGSRATWIAKKKF